MGVTRSNTSGRSHTSSTKRTPFFSQTPGRVCDCCMHRRAIGHFAASVESHFLRTDFSRVAIGSVGKRKLFDMPAVGGIAS